MKREVPQDVVPPHKKSIRNIPIPNGRRARPQTDTPHAMRTSEPPVIHDEVVAYNKESLTIKRHQEPQQRYEDQKEYEESEEDNEMVEQHTPTRRVVSFEEDDRPRKRGSKRLLIVSSGVAVFVLAVVLIFFSFGGATVTVYPRQVTTTLGAQLVASNVATPEAAASSSLTFAANEIIAEATRKVEATGEEEVIEKATGSIVIHNEYSEEEQRLVKNTRFQAPDGKIFRIPESVVVPGLTRDGSGNVVAGKIKTQVIADEPGKEYNIGPSRFTVPGFEGLPQYSGFYAVSDTSMSGGFNGIKKIVSDEDRNRAERELRDEIKQQLVSQAKAQTTDELIVLVDDSLTVYETLDEVAQGDTVTLGMRGKTKSVILDTRALAYALALDDLNSFKETDTVKITNLDELRIRALATTGDVAFSTVRIAIEGDAEFEWQLDEEAFKAELAGADKDVLAGMVTTHNAITRADGKFRPIWKGTFPSNPEKISIVYVKE